MGDSVLPETTRPDQPVPLKFADMVPFGHNDLCVLINKDAISQLTLRKVLDEQVFCLNDNSTLEHLTVAQQQKLSRRKGDVGLGLGLLSPVAFDVGGKNMPFAAETGECRSIFEQWKREPLRASALKCFVHRIINNDTGNSVRPM